MTIELKARIGDGPVKTTAQISAGHFGKHRSWIRCPRCIGGNMYLDNNGEFICIQCGCSCFPAAVSKITTIARESPKTESNLFHDISNALKNQRSVQSADSIQRQ